MPSRENFTELLLNLRAGETGAGEALLPMIYDELHALAGTMMHEERRGHTLQTTALVNEAYIRLGGEKSTPWESRAHFLRVAAKAMRRVLIDYARKRKSSKGEGGLRRIPFDEALAAIEVPLDNLLDLDDAMTRLGEIDPQLAQVVELRYFGGLTLEETARILGISTWTVKKDWRVARAWLKQEMGGAGKGEGGK